jgi:hypothetical protein
MRKLWGTGGGPVGESFIFSWVLSQKIDHDQTSKQYIDMSEDNLTKPKPSSYG